MVVENIDWDLIRKHCWDVDVCENDVLQRYVDGELIPEDEYSIEQIQSIFDLMREETKPASQLLEEFDQELWKEALEKEAQEE